MADLLLAEQLLLLAVDDERTRRHARGIGAGLTGALLVDPIRGGYIVEEEGRVAPAGERAPEHPLLREALDRIRESRTPRSLRAWVDRLPPEMRPLRERVARPLAERGVLREDRVRLFGLLFATDSWRPIRARLADVLLGAREPTEEEALLAGLLLPFDLDRRLVPRERRGDARRRAQALAEGEAPAAAVAGSVRDAQAAVTATIVAATVTSTSAAASS